jgi:probable phosphoglycerate mutase
MDLLLVRHAQPVRIEGGTGVPANPPLTTGGQAQAAALARWLASEHIDAVVSSPLLRALQTAQPIADAHGLAVKVEDGFAEFDVQADDYIPIEDLKAANDPRWQAMVDGTWEGTGGEHPDDFRRRVLHALDDVIARHAGQRVVAVCHGGVVNCVMGSVLGIERHLWFNPAYTSLNRMVASRSGTRSVVTLNETAHLEARRNA